MYIIGLTGGIGSGKSTVSNYFAALGIEIIDADRIARDLLKPETPWSAKVIAHFGKAIIDAHGHIDRTKVRQLIFQDQAAKDWLEALLHPAIRAEIKTAIEHVQSPYCIVVIPLLVESGLEHYDYMDRIVAVDIPEHLQIARLTSRDGASIEEAQNWVSQQASRAQRLVAADDIIDNSSDIQSLKATVNALHARYLALAQGKAAGLISSG